MNLHELVSQLIIDTKGSVGAGFLSFTNDSSLGVFRPEIALCVTIVVLLLVRLARGGRHLDAAWIALAGALIALYFVAPWRLVTDPMSYQRTEIFTGMLVYDGFSAFMRGLLLSFLVLFILMTKLTGVPDREDGTDVYTLVLGATLGFCLMASANHLLMVFMAVEMASVPSYVLAGMAKRQRLGSEAALKYAVYGAGAAGIMLYGISLIAGLVNAVHLPTVALRLAAQVPEMGVQHYLVLILGFLMIAVGLAFKLSAVPFHFWCPDVFEGATAEIGGFLSVASKAAALALLVRVAIGFGALVPASGSPDAMLARRATENRAVPTGLFSVQDHDIGKADTKTGDAASEAKPAEALGSGDAIAADDGLHRIRYFLSRLIALLAVVTCTFGNLAAYSQTNIKRLLAYSTIAHAGYMMMAVPPLLALIGVNTGAAQYAVASLAIYISVYLFMNLGAFAIVAFLRNAMGSEEIKDYTGLLRRCPGTTICLSIILLSLIGLPPLSGFLGKFAVFAALTEGFRYTGEPYLMALFVIGGINSAISLYYYLRVVKLMTMEPEPESRVPFSFPFVSLPGAYICLLTLPTAVLIVGWERLNELALAAARTLLS